MRYKAPFILYLNISTWLILLFFAVVITSCKKGDGNIQRKDIAQQAQINYDAGVALSEKYEFEDA